MDVSNKAKLSLEHALPVHLQSGLKHLKSRLPTLKYKRVTRNRKVKQERMVVNYFSHLFKLHNRVHTTHAGKFKTFRL